MRSLVVIVLLVTGTFVRAADHDSSGTVTPNFRIHWCAAAGDVRALADRCERLAAASKETWLTADRRAAWVPQCDVIVHPDTADYVQCLGAGSEQTSGCATIRLQDGRVVLRRIDLRADAGDWMSEALPHELTHVVLADRFCRTQIPPWADEGIAMLSESPQKLKQRLSDLRQAANGGLVYTPRELTSVKSSPEPAFRALFFGQSLELVSLLLECGSREQLLQFVDASQTKDFDAALRDVYGDRRSSQFEQQYRACLLTDRPLAWARQDAVADAIGPGGTRPSRTRADRARPGDAR